MKTTKLVKKKLTKVQRRIAVLKDALAQVKLGSYTPDTGSVCNLKYVIDVTNENKNKQLQKLLTPRFLKQKECTVCQRGALILSMIRKENSFKIGDVHKINNGSFSPTSTTDKRLGKLFSMKQIALMEIAFERSSFENRADIDYDLVNKAIDFGDTYNNVKERQIAILENAIKNKGIFIPE